MIPAALRAVPAGSVDVTAPVTIDGLSYVAADDPAMPMYRVIANNRTPVALRDLMIRPVRAGYIGAGRQPDPALVPPSGRDAVPGVDVEQIFLPVRDGVARCQLYRPIAAPVESRLPIIVYYHGGGFTVGASEDCDFLTRKLAVTNSALVVSANYRSAPEFMFPTPLDDAFDVYCWVAEHGGQLGGDTARIAVAGDSAGSNIAAALALRARAEEARPPDAVVMLGAMPDFHFERWESFRRQAPRGIVYDMAFAGFIRGAYVGPTPWDHPWVNPIDGDLIGYPLTVIAAGMPHGFYFFPGVHHEENVAYEIVAEALAGPFSR
ncbi:alpha/beta hydrolase fold domain-containing protein [Mycolicibacterium sp. S2-37]|uniref:alpha/beta hydrolase fold domain-containing protein n=1 Tax=Mycolicibacterium sp. S2-37 TaxID=2810297 RepID=UPI001A950030|nr:alpha/beta hydrolase fold domain-containing protein [Mycolicibacterium sp. S2-37]MBO0675941.1 alpha/beta hydrolase fold domain-containing protein [Mycolicibacterium sp. S2-37]